MKIPNITGLVKVGKTFVQANRPEILFGASITATIASVILAAKGGYEARGIVEAEKYQRFMDSENGDPGEFTVKEKIQLTWLCYMPAAVGTIGALGSTTGLHIVHVKEKKMLAASALAAIEEVKLSAKAYADDVKVAIEENTTPKTADKIEGAIEEKVVTRLIGDGSLYMVQDAYTGRPFYATESKIQSAINDVNELLNHNKDVDLNYFYIQAGVPEIDRGDEYGWSGKNVSIKWTDVHLEDGRPARQFTFNPQPRKGFDTSSQ